MKAKTKLIWVLLEAGIAIGLFHYYYQPVLALQSRFDVDDGVECVVFSPDGTFVAAGSGFDRNVVEIWDVGSGVRRATLSGHNEAVHAVAYNADGSRIASASRDKSIKLWDAATHRNIATLSGHTDEVYAVAFDPSGTILASAGWDRTIRLWNSATYATDKVVRLDKTTGRNPAGYERSWNKVCCLAFSQDGKTLATGGFDQVIRLWRVSDCESIGTLDGHSWCVHAVTYSSDDSMLASGSDREIKIWDTASGKVKLCIDAHTDIVSSLAFGPDNRTLVSGSWDGTIKVWDVETGNNRCAVRADRRHVYSVAFNKSGTTVASGGLGGEILLWGIRASSR